MATRRLELQVGLDGLRTVLRGLLDDAGFIIMDEEERGEELRVLALNRRRTSLMSVTIMSMFTGYVPQRRLALEFIAHRSGEEVSATLRCTPYLDNADLEAVAEGSEEIGRCEKLLGLFADKVLELTSSGSKMR